MPLPQFISETKTKRYKKLQTNKTKTTVFRILKSITSQIFPSKCQSLTGNGDSKTSGKANNKGNQHKI